MNANLAQMLEKEEGRRRACYQDHLGYWTIGVGRLIDERRGGGLTDDEIDYLLANDIARKTAEIEAVLPWAKSLDEVRRAVLIAMAFQMGVTGMLQFKTALAHARLGDYKGAASSMLDSRWARQTPARAQRMAKQMETGQWQ